jgi:hypothetical protein
MMKAWARPKTQRLLLLTLLIAGMSIFFWVQVQPASLLPVQPTNKPSELAMDGQTPSPSVTATPLPRTNYDPVTYGLPDKIAGYEVLAAVPIESQMCAEPGSMIILVIQVPRTEVDDEQIMMMQNAVLETRRQMDIKIEILPEVVGSTVTREKVRADYAYREKVWRDEGSGCAISGAIFLGLGDTYTLTPALAMEGQTQPASATPRTSYDPATYGLPNQIAGYDVLAAVPTNFHLCAEINTITIVIQVSEPTMDEYLRNGGTQKSIFEAVREIDPAGKLIIEVVGSGTTREKIWAEYATLEQGMRNAQVGCVRSVLPILGNGSMTVRPTNEATTASPIAAQQ